MKNKKQVSDIIYDYTFFPSGKYKHYLSIVELYDLFGRIIQTNETVEYIRAIPFYKTSQGQQEFDNYMFFCKRLQKGESAEKFLRECTNDEFDPCGGIIRCYENNDVISFHKALKDYLAYMPVLVNELYQFLTVQCDIQNADLLLGSLCFEVTAR